MLYNLIDFYNLNRVLVFVNRRDESRELESKLKRHGFNAGLLAGDVPQKKRLRTLEDFRSGKIKVLVATDVAGRGLHIEDISHVVNYNLPEDPEDYIHRIGRTGRAGAEGISITLACESDAFMLPNIETLLGRPLNCQHPPEELIAETPTLPPAPLTDRPPQGRSKLGRGRRR